MRRYRALGRAEEPPAAAAWLLASRHDLPFRATRVALMGANSATFRALFKFDFLLAKVIVELAGRLLGGYSSPHGVGGQWEQYTRQ